MGHDGVDAVVIICMEGNVQYSIELWQSWCPAAVQERQETEFRAHWGRRVIFTVGIMVGILKK